MANVFSSFIFADNFKKKKKNPPKKKTCASMEVFFIFVEGV